MYSGAGVSWKLGMVYLHWVGPDGLLRPSSPQLRRHEGTIVGRGALSGSTKATRASGLRIRTSSE